MQELVFSAKDLFNDETDDGCLFQYEANKFLIPAYQRGYKWGSQKKTDPVPTLLNDLWLAFERTSTLKIKREYYLQYITVKKVDNCLEIIDGQQRLTTLSILFSVLQLHLENADNIAKDKLEYSIRGSFFKEHVYDKDKISQLLSSTWDRDSGVVLGDKKYNTQDVFYLFNAAKKINDFLSEERVAKNIVEFTKFLKRDVKVIVNSVEFYVPSERVFNNLNSNKIPLTEVELIKALFITKLARIETIEQKKHFREILEARSLLGKHWDEITACMREPEFSSFFFLKEGGMESLLELVAKSYDYKPEKSEKDESAKKNYPLFNFYNSKNEKLSEVFERIKLYFSVLTEWYRKDEIYNLLGFIFFAKTTNVKRAKFIVDNVQKSKKKLIEEGLKIRRTLLALNIKTTQYGDNEMNNALLAMSVFDESNKEPQRFDYYSYTENKWSLEHIFPQSPEGKTNILNDTQRQLVLEMLGGASASPRMKELMSKGERDEDEKAEYYLELKNRRELNSIGNMALLTQKDNSSNGCGFFDEKRANILGLIKKGSFVPKHTFDVFSKMIFPSDPGNLTGWSKENIISHQEVIQNFIDKLNQPVESEIG